jgi:peptidoglycan/LPS O-acetylase OafA/YrhL
VKTSKSTISVFFALLLAIIFLLAARYVGSITNAGSQQFAGIASIFWYALGGFVLGLGAGILILRHLSKRTLGIASIALGILAFIALASLFFFYEENPEEKLPSSPKVWTAPPQNTPTT